MWKYYAAAMAKRSACRNSPPNVALGWAKSRLEKLDIPNSGATPEPLEFTFVDSQDVIQAQEPGVHGASFLKVSS